MKKSRFNSMYFLRILALVLLFGSSVSTARAAYSPGDTVVMLIQLSERALCGLKTFNEGLLKPQREFTKTISRDFATLANGMTALYNRHGKVNVKTWKENKVKIDISIIVNADDQSEADRTFEKINVNFTNTSGYIKAETMVGEMKSKWGTTECRDFKINYDVWMPSGNQLDLRNKYGNSFVATLNGKLTADIRYGDLITEAINADAEILIEYGKATLASSYNLSGQVGYGGIYVNQANDIQMDSRNSECTFRNASSVRLTSRYDDLNFGILKDLRLQTKYSDLEVKSVQSAFITAQYTAVEIMQVVNELDADLKYGSLEVGSLSKNFSSVTVVANYTDVEIRPERNTPFRFDISGNYTDVELPAGAVSRRVANVAGGRNTFQGYVGDSNAKGIIKGQMNAGNFDIQY